LFRFCSNSKFRLAEICLKVYG